MGKKKKVVTSNTKKIEKKQIEVEIEFTTEIPIEVLCVACEFLPLKVLLKSIMRVSKEAKKFVEDTIKKRRALGMVDYSVTYLRFQYDLGKKSKCHSCNLIDKKSGRFVIEYEYQDKQVIAVVDPFVSGQSHIFEVKSKLDDQNPLSYLTLRNMNISNQIIIYTKKYLEIHNIEKSKILYTIRFFQSDFNTPSNKEYSHENPSLLTKVNITSDGLLCLTVNKSVILYRYTEESGLKYLEFIENFPLEKILYLTDDYYAINLFQSQYPKSDNIIIYSFSKKVRINVKSKTVRTPCNLFFTTFQIDPNNFLIGYDGNMHLYHYKDNDKWILYTTQGKLNGTIRLSSGIYMFSSSTANYQIQTNEKGFPKIIKADKLLLKSGAFDKLIENDVILHYSDGVGIYTSDGKYKKMCENKFYSMEAILDYKFGGYDENDSSFKIYQIFTK